MGAQIWASNLKQRQIERKKKEVTVLSNLWQQTSSLAPALRLSTSLLVAAKLRHNVASLLSPPYCATAVATWTVSMCDTCLRGRSVPPPPPHLGNVPLQGFFVSGDHS
jgi:hypothetical protein